MSRHRRLLVFACFASKRPDPGRFPARDRVTARSGRRLRSDDPKGRRAKVAFLSARFGFRDAQGVRTRAVQNRTPPLSTKDSYC